MENFRPNFLFKLTSIVFFAFLILAPMFTLGNFGACFILGDSITLLHKKHKLFVSAHRGNSKMAPENTLATFGKILEIGVDYIEIDVRTTKDSHLVILHDRTLNRTTNGTGAVENYTLSEVKALSTQKNYGDIFKNETIPTLSETCELVNNWNKTHKHKTNLYVDCKTVEAKALVQEIKKYNLLKNAVFYGSDDFLVSLKKEFPKAKVLPSLNNRDEISAKIEKLNPYAFDVRWQILTDSLVKEIHSKKIKVFSDALDLMDNQKNYLKATKINLDVIQTDKVRSVFKTLLN